MPSYPTLEMRAQSQRFLMLARRCVGEEAGQIALVLDMMQSLEFTVPLDHVCV
jgi:hypothetical protein